MPELEDILGSRTKIAILRYLTAVRPALSGNEIAARLGLRQSSVHHALASLVETGVVTRTDMGRSAAYTIDDELTLTRSVLIPLFQEEARLRSSLIKELTRECKKLTPKPRAVILFGSLARGDRTFRDADLLCVVEEKREKQALHDHIAGRFEQIRRRYALPVSAVIATEAELRAKESHALVSEVRRDGILLFGTTPGTFKGMKHHDP